MRKISLFLSVLLTASFLSSCKKDTPSPYVPVVPEMSVLKKQYKLAVMDAKYAEPWEIWRSLIAVEYYGDSTAGEGNLVWSRDSLGRERLLVVSWMKQSSLKFWPMGKPFKTSNNPAYDSWITSCPQMLQFLKKNNFTDTSSLNLRIAQLLGMPPDTPNNYFVEFWVYPKKLFRPAPDPEVTDHEAGLYFPSGVSTKHRDWFNNEIKSKYDTSSSSCFPWTRLGYTYDWADPLHPVGLSEFVVDTSAWVMVKAVYSSWQYYKLAQTTK
jgi:hypothetical protein